MKFFMVFNPQGISNPRVQHPDISTARAEAERLASKNPGQTFYVMEAVTYSVAPHPRVVTGVL